MTKSTVAVTGVRCDVVEYRQLLDQGCIPEAEALFKGELLAGAGGGSEFEEWVRGRRDQIMAQRTAALTRHAHAREAAGDQRGALNVWLNLLTHDELAESWHREAMRLHGLLGEREQALTRFARCVAVLDHELGLSPLPETVALAEQLRGSVTVSGVARPPSGTLEELPFTGPKRCWSGWVS